MVEKPSPIYLDVFPSVWAFLSYASLQAKDNEQNHKAKAVRELLMFLLPS